MFSSQDLVDGAGEVLPSATLACECRSPFGGQTIVSAATLSGLFYPPPDDQGLRLQPAKDWVQGPDPELKTASRTCLDELSQLVAVSGTCLKQGHDQKFGAALLEFAAKHRGWILLDTPIYWTPVYF
jgi:hypothetical protein